jgi:hypothetical protein
MRYHSTIQTSILKSWILKNIKNPYPTFSQKMELSKLTGLSFQQTEDWFLNARKTKWFKKAQNTPIDTNSTTIIYQNSYY